MLILKHLVTDLFFLITPDFLFRHVVSGDTLSPVFDVNIVREPPTSMLLTKPLMGGGQLEECCRMSLPGSHTDPADGGASDGAIGIDHWWKKTLEKAMKDTPLAASLIEAIQGMRDLDGVCVLYCHSKISVVQANRR